MDNPRSEKVEVVDEVRGKLSGADAVLLTEYRGLSVGEMASLRNAMRPAGGEYKVYKNTLVRRAAAELGLELDAMLTGPVALAFVGVKADGSAGDISTVAKAVQDFAKSQPLLVLKGGVLGDRVLDAAAAKALASLPTAPEIFARLAGAINSQARGLAGVVSGVHRSLGYVLQACIDAGAFAGDEPAKAAVDEAPTEVTAADEAPTEVTAAVEASSEDVPAAPAATEESPAAVAADETAADAAEESE